LEVRWAKFGDVPDTLPTKQRFWNRPGVLEDKAQVEASVVSAYYVASFLAASCQHSGDWLFALPIASCGLKLDDEAVRVAVGLRLGLDLCIPHHWHQCHYGSPVYARGLHSFVCKRAPGRSARHHALNDFVARCFASAGTTVITGLFRTDVKRPLVWHLFHGKAASHCAGKWTSGIEMLYTRRPWLGRNCHMSTGWILRHWVRPRGRCCNRACFHFILKIYEKSSRTGGF